MLKYPKIPDHRVISRRTSGALEFFREISHAESRVKGTLNQPQTGDVIKELRRIESYELRAQSRAS